MFAVPSFFGYNTTFVSTPVATAATGVGETSFTANWNAFAGAQYYLFDVSTSPSFSSFVLQNEVVLAPTTAYVVVGLTANTTYYYRLRASTDSLFLLDQYPSAAVAYSVRKLRAAYTGNAIRVRRSSDNTEQNIGFTALGNLDTTALTTFCSGTNGFVTTWYDQSGNARNATQTTAANQPQIVSSGAVLTVNSKPCTVFSGASATRLNVGTNFWTYTGNSTVFHASLNTHTSYQSVISYFEGANTSLGIQYTKYPATATNVSTDVYAPGGMATDNTQSASVQYLVSMQWQNWSTHKTNGNTIIAINGANQAISPYGSSPSAWANNGVTRIGTFDATGNWDGKIQELVIYTTALSGSNIDGAESNINTYYGIY